MGAGASSIAPHHHYHPPHLVPPLLVDSTPLVISLSPLQNIALSLCISQQTRHRLLQAIEGDKVASDEEQEECKEEVPCPRYSSQYTHHCNRLVLISLSIVVNEGVLHFAVVDPADTLVTDKGKDVLKDLSKPSLLHNFSLSALNHARLSTPSALESWLLQTKPRHVAYQNSATRELSITLFSHDFLPQALSSCPLVLQNSDGPLIVTLEANSRILDPFMLHEQVKEEKKKSHKLLQILEEKSDLLRYREERINEMEIARERKLKLNSKRTQSIAHRKERKWMKDCFCSWKTQAQQSGYVSVLHSHASLSYNKKILQEAWREWKQEWQNKRRSRILEQAHQEKELIAKRVHMSAILRKISVLFVHWRHHAQENKTHMARLILHFQTKQKMILSGRVLRHWIRRLEEKQAEESEKNWENKAAELHYHHSNQEETLSKLQERIAEHDHKLKQQEIDFECRHKALQHSYEKRLRDHEQKHDESIGLQRALREQLNQEKKKRAHLLVTKLTQDCLNTVFQAWLNLVNESKHFKLLTQDRSRADNGDASSHGYSIQLSDKKNVLKRSFVAWKERCRHRSAQGRETFRFMLEKREQAEQINAVHHWLYHTRKQQAQLASTTQVQHSDKRYRTALQLPFTSRNDDSHYLSLQSNYRSLQRYYSLLFQITQSLREAVCQHWMEDEIRRGQSEHVCMCTKCVSRRAMLSSNPGATALDLLWLKPFDKKLSQLRHVF